MQFLTFNQITDKKIISFSNQIESQINLINLFSKYYCEYYGENFTDLSFIVLEDNQVVGYVLCSSLNKIFTMPDDKVIIELYNIPKTEKKRIYHIYQKILDHIDFLARQNQCKSIVIRDHLIDNSLSLLGEHLFNRKFECSLTFEMSINYNNFSEDGFHSTLRKSYRSLINWGKKSLQVTYVNKNNPDFKAFKEFQDFHFKISGRKTRSDNSWIIQYEMIKKGFGELILAVYNNSLVAGSLFLDYSGISLYYTGVYERDLFDFGISHFLMYDGVCRSFKRNNTSKFSFGYFDTDIKDPKWYNIQFFKKGFCNKLKPTILWSKEVNY